MKNRIQIVDLVRCLSILVVMANHLGCHYMTLASASPFWTFFWYKFWINGGFGVTIFFVVSGFVITRLIASQPKPHGLFNPDYRDFYARRAGRILPLLALTCLFGVVMISFFSASTYIFHYSLKNPDAVFRPSLWVSIATFTFYWYKLLWPWASPHYGLHWDVLWSLSIEEQFYFCYPFLLKKLGNERRLKLFLVLLIFFPPVFAAFHTFYFPGREIPVLGSLAPFGAIATGCLLYLFTRRFKPSLSKNKGASFFIFVSGLAVFLNAYLHQDYKADFMGHIMEGSLITWGMFLLLLGGLHLDFFNRKVWTPLAFPGSLSYGGYLMHPAILYFFWPFFVGTNEYAAFFIFMIATFSVAYLSYRFFEMPANFAIRRILGRPSSRGS